MKLNKTHKFGLASQIRNRGASVANVKLDGFQTLDTAHVTATQHWPYEFFFSTIEQVVVAWKEMTAAQSVSAESCLRIGKKSKVE